MNWDLVARDVSVICVGAIICNAVPMFAMNDQIKTFMSRRVFQGRSLIVPMTRIGS